MGDSGERGDEVVVRDAEIIQEFALRQMPDKQREGFLGLITTDQDAESKTTGSVSLSILERSFFHFYLPSISRDQ